MEDHRIRKVTVLGGGTAGWMAASYLGKALGPEVKRKQKELAAQLPTHYDYLRRLHGH